MKKLIKSILAIIIKYLFKLRYRIHYKGIEDFNAKNLDADQGILFLPNHPSQLDGAMVYEFAKHHCPRPAAAEYLFDIPGVCQLLKLLNAISVPNLEACSNSLKKVRMDEAIEKMSDVLKNRESILFYPAGRLKLTGVEMLGGASGLHKLLQKNPNTNIILVRITGLWGSSFSRALTGKVPTIAKMLLQGLKHIIKNLIFFTPRRKITVEVVTNPPNFPHTGTRLEINSYLNNFYNNMEKSSENRDIKGEPLKLVSYSMWQKELPKTVDFSEKAPEIMLDRISNAIKSDVIDAVAKLTHKKAEEILPSDLLIEDLSLDSLDATDLLIFLEDNYGVTGIQPNHLIKVDSIMAYASGQLKISVDEEEEERTEKDKKRWLEKNRLRPHIEIPKGITLPEVFLNNCNRMGSSIACTDLMVPPISYKGLKIRTILLAEKLRNLEGDKIGILLPASVSAMVTVFACMLAGKIPVMINWTVGTRHIKHVLEITKLQHILSAWKVLDKLENISLSEFSHLIVPLEDVRRKITLIDKLKALFLSKKSTQSILQHFNIQHCHEREAAVYLFTSGSEALPKGVPLSHYNILENSRSGIKSVDFAPNDILLGMLPPFHSFGFCVTGLLPLLSGIKVAFSPDPTDAGAIARCINRWKATIVCNAPSFHRAVFRTATEEQLESVRLFVTGSERAPKDLFIKVNSLKGNKQLIEGYGITECSPILTINRPNESKIGVGRAIEGVELYIVDPESHQPLPNHKQGLILAHGPNIFDGYLAYKGPSPFITLHGKRWYNTGDLGFLNDYGHLTISGRLKRFTKIGAEMISLGALEEAILEVAPSMGWAMAEESPPLAVCAVEPENEKPQLILITRNELPLTEINAKLKELGFNNLSRINKVYPIHTIPMTGTGKTHYRELQTMLESRALA